MKRVTLFVASVFVVYALALATLVSDHQSKSDWRWPAGEMSIEYFER